MNHAAQAEPIWSRDLASLCRSTGCRTQRLVSLRCFSPRPPWALALGTIWPRRASARASQRRWRPRLLRACVLSSAAAVTKAAGAVSAAKWWVWWLAPPRSWTTHVPPHRRPLASVPTQVLIVSWSCPKQGLHIGLGRAQKPAHVPTSARASSATTMAPRRAQISRQPPCGMRMTRAHAVAAPAMPMRPRMCPVASEPIRSQPTDQQTFPPNH